LASAPFEAADHLILWQRSANSDSCRRIGLFAFAESKVLEQARAVGEGRERERAADGS